MTPYELMLSESQERMLAIIPKDKWEKAEAILNKWEVNPRVIGEITDDGLMRVKCHGQVVAEMPADKISSNSPCYIRESKEPGYLKDIEVFSTDKVDEPENIEETFLALMASPTLSSKRWIYEQYDHMVQTCTMIPPGENSGVLRVRGSKKLLAATADCNGLYCYLDPWQGAAIAVAEAARNLATTGARPLAITNCLNFGNPTKPEIFWQFEECIRGMGDACREFNTPVTGGNVSFYNEYDGKAVYPTPMIGMVGIIDSEEMVTMSGFKREGDAILLIEPEKTELHLGGTYYMEYLHNKIMGPCPTMDLAVAGNLVTLCLELIRSKLIQSAHDISEGGFGQAVAECVVKASEGIGAAVTLPGRTRADIELFSEAQSRIVVSASPGKIEEIRQICSKFSFKVHEVGTVTNNERMVVKDIIDVVREDLLKSHTTLPWREKGQ
jgi:phosphoribosylformylglycinamidine synthase